MGSQLLLCICLGTLTCLPAAWATTIREVKQPASPPGFVICQTTASSKLSPAEAERVIAHRARQVILALRSGDTARLSTFVHPEKGVRFSPYAYVSPHDDLVFRRKQLPGLWASKRRYMWGSYDGSGDPIRLTYRRYYRRFIYDYDFSQAKRVRYNDAVMGLGNTLNNVRDIYPRGVNVEYNFPGTAPAGDGMDWKSLWLVFEKRGGKWYLAGIVHDEWTI